MAFIWIIKIKSEVKNCLFFAKYDFIMSKNDIRRWSLQTLAFEVSFLAFEIESKLWAIAYGFSTFLDIET